MQEQVSKLESQKRQLVDTGKNYLAPNDTAANLMKSRHGKIPAYNGQTIVDKKHRMIILSEIRTETCDINQLKDNVDDLKEQVDIEPEILDADKGYANYKEIKEIEDNSSTKCFVPSVKNNKKEEDKKAGIKFIYDKEKDEYKCSQGKRLKLIQKNKKRRNNLYNVYQCSECNECPLKAKCTKSKKGRSINRNIIQDWIDKYKKRMLETKSKERIKKRKTIVEHQFGTIKWMMGQFHFLLTGKEKVQVEFDLYATTYNFKRLINIDKMELLLVKANNYTW